VTFKQLIAVVRDWQARLTPEQARTAIEDLAIRVTVSIDGWWLQVSLDVDAVLAFAASGQPAVGLVDVGKFLQMPEPPRTSKGAKPARAALPSEPPPRTPRPARHRGRPAMSDKARALLCEQLANGPKPESQIAAAAEAADISERTLMAAAGALGVRTRRGQWWLPG
jgi:hypothetical protein